MLLETESHYPTRGGGEMSVQKIKVILDRYCYEVEHAKQCYRRSTINAPWEVRCWCCNRNDDLARQVSDAADSADRCQGVSG